MKKLLLHICCAPDATTGIERLSREWDLHGLFHNPNIHPSSEYERRRASMDELSEATGIAYEEGGYDPDRWMIMVEGLEEEPEKGKRCEVCVRERLRESARRAKEGGYDAFAAVLTVSPHKDADLVNRLGAEAGAEFGVPYLPTDLKKMDGFKRSVELARKLGLYRQDYCGCEFSKRKPSG